MMRFAREGKVDETLVEIVSANVREPIQVVGDLYSLATCNEIGCRRLIEMMDEFAIDDLDRLGTHILEKSKQASLEAIRKIKPGTYSYSMTRRRLTTSRSTSSPRMTIGDSGIDVDFAGTSGVSAYGINVPVCYTEAYASFGVKCIVAPKVPNNEGSLSVIRVTAPPNSILNALQPAPVAARHVIGQMLPDVMFGCLHQALGGARAGRGHVVPVEPVRAGRPGLDRRRSVRDRPRQAVQRHELPCRRHRRAAGRRRPLGDGLPERREERADRGQRGGVADRRVAQGIPPGFRRRRRVPRRAGPDHGGRHARQGAVCAQRLLRPHRPSGARPRRRPDGIAGSLTLSSGKVLRGKGLQTVPSKDRVIIAMPGGGGLGNPRKRPAAVVAEDVRQGFISSEAARRDYGVAVNDDGTVDEAETAKLRAIAAE